MTLKSNWKRLFKYHPILIIAFSFIWCIQSFKTQLHETCFDFCLTKIDSLLSFAEFKVSIWTPLYNLIVLFLEFRIFELHYLISWTMIRVYVFEMIYSMTHELSLMKVGRSNLLLLLYTAHPLRFILI